MVSVQTFVGGGVIKYLLVGAISVVLPTFLSRFMPSGLQGGMMGAAVLVILGVMLRGKVPSWISGGMIAAAGIAVIAPIFSGVLGGATATATDTSSGLDLA